MELQFPELPEEALPIALAVWVFIGMLKPLLYRLGFSTGFISDSTPVFSLLLNTGLAYSMLAENFGEAIIFGMVMTIIASGAHETYQHFTERSALTGQRDPVPQNRPEPQKRAPTYDRTRE